MGSWGEGMRDNDNACDAIALFEKDIARVARSKRGLLPLLKTVEKKYHNADEVLGVSEELLEQGVFFTIDAAKLLQSYLGAELQVIQEWKDPDKRALALGAFAARVNASILRRAAPLLVLGRS